jgi:hypothetical protein
MIPGKFPLVLYRGDWYTFRVLLWQDEGGTVPFDLAAYTPAAQIRDKAGGETVTDLTCTVTLPNTIDVEVGPANWADIPTLLAGAWDLEIRDAAENPLTPLAGPVAITPDVTVVS